MTKPFIIITLGLLSCASGAFAFAEGDNTTPAISVPALVEVDGVKLTLADYGRKHPGGMFQAYQTFYRSERKAMEDYVDEYLLDRQAEKEKVTVAQLLERHVTSAVGKDPSEDALRVYYDGVETDQPFEAVRDQILAQIREVRLARAKAAYLKSIHAAAHISYQFGPPRAPITLKDTQVRGLPDAPVVIVEFADYECPYCQQAQPALDQIEEEFKGKIAFAFKDMPLPNHSHALKVAEATHCAAVQGKYWEYHDMVFRTRGLEMKQLKDHARELKLDTAAFDKCLDSGAQAEAVKGQYMEGLGFGLNGTPGFFINGRFFSGLLSVEQLRAMIGEELALSAARGKDTTAKR